MRRYRPDFVRVVQMLLSARTKKKRQVTFTDSFKVSNVILHSFFVLFLYNLSSLLIKLTKFHSIFSDDYEKKKNKKKTKKKKKNTLLTVWLARQYLVYLLFVAYTLYPGFIFRPSIYKTWPKCERMV